MSDQPANLQLRARDPVGSKIDWINNTFIVCEADL